MDQETRGPARTGKRAPYANGAKKRAELVEAAFQVFAEKGYLGLSIRQIAEAVGTSHTALLHHFGSKEALLEAVLVLREEREGPWRTELISNKGLLETVPAVMRHNAGIRGVIQLDATLRAEAINPDHPAHDFLLRRNQDFVDSVRAELERELAAGRLRDGISPIVVARQITSLVDGIQLAWLYDESVDMADHLQGFMELIKHP
ncbi:TetR/AcrR family transcriptional regulator [Paenarthrobacter ilicis]|uniref:AcrR family transcriptional regulator n=1 Tax=Paenarthrobacter ilicis TaxID=43665 RepID=A0ABX0TML4_9MICC|nr:TetR/AcrR family transcriptional regulator [Paenarthrobacter ilicis]MBM7793108.1 AcrR family transcriptional regulator [Paenarthrobacter ilicis]NIJ02116.1 AcrR family transcriptional regulator [Paenarthrobacter ilicis]